MDGKKQETPAKRQRQSTPPSGNSQSNQLETTLNKYRKQRCFCDFTIEIPNHEFPVHRNMLAAKSKYFEDLFRSSQTRMRWDQLNKDGVEACLQYIYTGDYSLDFRIADVTLYAAHTFKLTHLRATILDSISASLNSENCFVIERIACTIKDTKLEKKARDWIVSHFDEIIERAKNFHTVPKVLLKYCIRNSQNPKAIIKGITKWFCHPKNVQRKDELVNFLEDIFFECFSLDNFISFRDELKLDLPQGAQYIEREISSRYRRGQLAITPGNWMSLRGVFKSLRQADLERAINLYAIANLAQLSRSDTFYEIGKIDLIYFLKSRTLPWSREWENIIWSAMLKWVKFNRSRQAMLPELLQAIDLTNFSIEFLQEVVKNDVNVTNDTRSLNILVECLCRMI